MNTLHRFGLAALSAALLGGAAYSLAASDNAPPPRGPGFEHSAHGPMLPLRELNLTDAQKQQLEQFREAQKPGMEAARKALHDAHDALRTFTDSGNTDQTKLRALADAEGKAVADMAVLHAGFKQKLLSVLTPDQQQKLQQLAAEHKEHGPRGHFRHGKDASAPASK
ncbi:protein refolding chaperone Spy/CpxP family [Andreprevotia lacus DSM 23236]|jgi:Spy/CpxP family protein refolding chaperone|uniref:Protein refolding chaperone Spy/CpxP family n=1 Tax=Andreprevotia lacus DSM 23236 TaxID=1121001 RepID=A0A1W1XAQ8_9NEIS|nr:Spy/CpxP family protein refolding chaperone [Andreprevotia lacus]SMC20611.1 protein refolding chaperone Spy/CpxP family [Andreprevotia lacus DSM 23236]